MGLWEAFLTWLGLLGKKVRSRAAEAPGLARCFCPPRYNFLYCTQIMMRYSLGSRSMSSWWAWTTAARRLSLSA